jgi:hypothetical protein
MTTEFLAGDHERASEFDVATREGNSEKKKKEKNSLKHFKKNECILTEDFKSCTAENVPVINQERTR